ASVPALGLRIGFVGELGYEIHVASPYAEYLWDMILELGADLGIRPFGLEPQRILRLEKMHIIVGQDTDSESNALEANMPWIVKFEKDDFVGRRALEHVRERGFRDLLVGFEIDAPEAERLLRRLTDLDLEALPAVGAVARVPALVVREAPDRFRLWFPQEYSDYVAEVVLDAWEGLR